ncbi:hypothetical protein Bbelb_326420 [Branchiostoma belcheri]|nr:hypothetical protein Bbelb_326420 [Branchiostoma belcheri]
MRLFVSVLLVTMVVVAMLIDDSEGWRRRRRRRRKGGKLDADDEADGELMEVMQEARSLLEELDDLDEAPEPRMEEREYEEKGLRPGDRK